MNTETITMLPWATTENAKLALECIKSFAKQRNLVVKGNIDAILNVPFVFNSRKQEKKFRWSISRILRNQTMKSSNLFLLHLSKITGTQKVTIMYSPEELAIKEAKLKWKQLQKQTEEARLFYKNTKGSFYK